MSKQKISPKEAAAMFNVTVMRNIEDAWPTFSKMASGIFKIDFNNDMEAQLRVAVSTMAIGVAYLKRNVGEPEWLSIHNAMMENLSIPLNGLENILISVYQSALNHAIEVRAKALHLEKEAEMMGRVVHLHFNHKNIMRLEDVTDTSPLTDMLFAGCCRPLSDWWKRFLDQYELLV